MTYLKQIGLGGITDYWNKEKFIQMRIYVSWLKATKFVVHFSLRRRTALQTITTTTLLITVHNINFQRNNSKNIDDHEYYNNQSTSKNSYFCV
jgi:hypothetical protein